MPGGWTNRHGRHCGAANKTSSEDSFLQRRVRNAQNNRRASVANGRTSDKICRPRQVESENPRAFPRVAPRRSRLGHNVAGRTPRGRYIAEMEEGGKPRAATSAEMRMSPELRCLR